MHLNCCVTNVKRTKLYPQANNIICINSGFKYQATNNFKNLMNSKIVINVASNWIYYINLYLLLYCLIVY